MNQAEEDDLFQVFTAERDHMTGERTAFSRAIRAAVAAERESAARVCEERIYDTERDAWGGRI